MLLRAKKKVLLAISFEQCSYVILEKAYSITSRPKVIVINHYGHPKNDQERIFSINF